MKAVFLITLLVPHEAALLMFLPINLHINKQILEKKAFIDCMGVVFPTYTFSTLGGGGGGVTRLFVGSILVIITVDQISRIKYKGMDTVNRILQKVFTFRAL